MLVHNRLLFFWVFNLLVCGSSIAQPASSLVTSVDKGSASLDITPFGVLKTWSKTKDPLGKTVGLKEFNLNTTTDSSDVGEFWWNARDIERIEVVHEANVANDAARLPIVQYWHKTWPEAPPKMPSTEDLEDDPWQGKWITAATNIKADGNTVTYTFQPLTTNENPNAAYLPGQIAYRRTLKLRLLYPVNHEAIRSVRFFSTSKEKNTGIRIQLLDNQKKNSRIAGSIDVFNGHLKTFSGLNWDRTDKKTGDNAFVLNWNGKPKGIIADISSSTQSLPGSNDETVVTFRSSAGTFSFSMNDVEKGPVYIPYVNVYITKANDNVSFSKSKVEKGKTIRERILEEPEQTYDRARNEIPPLDPTNRSHGGPIDLPLASDASWQKFAVQWGGNILLDKQETKAQGKELLRCNWIGNDLRWNIGTGNDPVFKRTRDNCQVSMLNDYLPVVQSSWNHKGLNYREEAFTVLLGGPLAPNDPKRDEQTPAVLLVKLTVSNPSLHADTAHVWLAANKAIKNLAKEGEFLVDEVDQKNYLRCYMPSANKTEIKSELLADSTGVMRTIHRQFFLQPNSSETLYFYFPFVGDLTAANKNELASLNYEVQKNRVTSYWRELVEKSIIFNVPERKFNEMAKAIIPHIRMSVTKEPKSGLYMVPAAALSYWGYPNEAIFQTLLLDRLGDFKTTSEYLNTFLQLQGSVKLPGTFTGDQKDVFYGLKIDSVYNWTEGNGYNMHHGTVLWGLASHYLYSGDREWLLKAAPHMIRAANWIIQQREQTKQLDEKGNKLPHYGLLPAGVLEDVHDWQFWYATNAYACLGMETMAKAFEKAGLPQADSFKKAAKAYHDDIRESVKTSSELSPVVRLRNNTYVPYVPSRPYQQFRYFGTKKAQYYDRYQKGISPNMRLSAIREALYGPIVLLKAGLIDPDEPMADWVLDDWEDNLTLSSSLNLNVHGKVDDEYWFSRGGMVFQANLQNPVGIYLIRQEIPATLRGLYDNFVSCLYPDVNAHTEEYHEWGHGSGPFYKCPDEARFISQVCDLLVAEKKDTLLLAAGTPRRWLEAGQNIELKKAQTEYGEVSYSLRQGRLPQTVEADLQLPPKPCPKILFFVRSPFARPIKKVMINGRPWKEWDADKELITVPQTEKHALITVVY
ncbi:hypothetical protein [Segetibacter koreensis]|uniref:hypothetical protein n=1 Tax=Segetibacter koreensis TaxID=398037 RepID=UPI00037FB242|nr:hypothetical protein [Segetibacter koreensis]